LLSSSYEYEGGVPAKRKPANQAESAESDARSTAALVDEFDAGRFEHASKDLKSGVAIVRPHTRQACGWGTDRNFLKVGIPFTHVGTPDSVGDGKPAKASRRWD
jgi:hypothetical protein